ncbi:Pkinase-domain-containing protein [Phanerochaete sordida]|uniref:Pkinase-domain-containing protein n=1 Tax=Phanerochaete sordida TaxID=48140 RepID=A0A9P3GBC0_9APHY|nr:Pkinase-domain-containing protein [Phanerochaete sordida]
MRTKRPEAITELEEPQELEPYERPRSALEMSPSKTRPRRSASMSEARGDELPNGYNPQSAYMRATAARGARRVTIEEKMKQEHDFMFLDADPRRDSLRTPDSYGSDELERQAMALVNAHAPPGALPYEQRGTPSPPKVHAVPTHHNLKSLYGQQRKDTEPARNGSPTLGSPTAMNYFPRGQSPQHRDSDANYVARAGYNGLQASGVRHRGSPHMAEQAAAVGMAAPHAMSMQSKAWTVPDPKQRDSLDDGEGSSGENFQLQQYQQQYQQEQHQQEHIQPQAQAPQQNGRMRPPPVPIRASQSLPQVQQQPQHHALPPPPPPPVPAHQPKTMFVNKRVYQRLDLLGKGGSSRVYRVMDQTSNEIYALKRVALDRTDPESMNGYMNEIALLKRLDGNHRIIRLIDSEVRRAGGGSKGVLHLLMECGEIDLAKLLQQQQVEPVDFVWVSYYWKQMLQAVHVIHEEKIVHSDLKPANFVLVKGQLKLIDFGIANAIANDTTNIQRDHQIGTVNYMSPEAIELGEGMRRLKVGRQSDIWSLGCILYQMVYGQPPFQHLGIYQKMRAIPDGSYTIDFPEYASPLARRTDPDSPQRRLDHLKVPVPKHVIETIKRCLVRNPKERAAIPELLDENWLTMREPAALAPSAPPTPPPPSPSPALKPDEVIINPFYMSQLLSYGIMLGKGEKKFEGEALDFEAMRLVGELQNVRASVPTPSDSSESASASEAEDVDAT